MKETARSMSAAAVCSPLDCTGQLGCETPDEKCCFCGAHLWGRPVGLIFGGGQWASELFFFFFGQGEVTVIH